MQNPRRKRPARQELFECGNRAEILFLTVGTKDRKRVLAKEDVHRLLVEIWKDPSNHWSVGRYVILPDHVHLFCSPRGMHVLDVKSWVGFWKSQASRRWPRPDEQPVWQPDVWDRQLRNCESYDEKWAYVLENPVRHGLVENAEEWPYQGEIHRLDWHD